MHKCRVCLLKKSDVRTTDELHEGISYASMLNYVAEIRVVEGNLEAICHLCSQKLIDSYFFRLLIIRSNQILNVSSKVFKFDSIKDVRAQIFQESCRKACNKNETKNIHTDCTSHDDTHSKILKKARDRLTAIYNLETEDEEDEDIPNDSEANEEEIYIYANNEEKELGFEKDKEKKNVKEMDKKYKKHHHTVKNVLIKPKYLEGLRMIPSKSLTKLVKKSVEQTVKRRVDICPYCGKKTKSMKTHLLLHTVTQKFECNDCARRFYTKSSLIHHIKLHSNEHIYQCGKCVASFNTRSGLKRHLHIHTDVKDHKCHICNKAFRMKTGLNRHILIHNINAKSFRCEFCNMSFLNKYTLKTHTRVHTRERPYSCELCSKPYGYKREFNRHCLNKHGVLIDRRSVYVMNEETLKKEKLLMKDLMLRVHGIPTEREPLDAFKGPQKALAFARAVKAIEEHKVPIDVQL